MNNEVKSEKSKRKITRLVCTYLALSVLGGVGGYHLAKREVNNSNGIRQEETVKPDDFVQVVTINSSKDTLWFLCKQIYGDGNYYNAVCIYNDISNYRNLRIGDKVKFPSKSVLDEIITSKKSR